MADKTPPRPPSEETIAKLLEVQSRELSVRTKDIELRQNELAHAAKWAEKTIDAQVQDRQAERVFQHKQTVARYLGAGVIALAILAFSGWALYLNKDAIVMEALKLIGSAAIGFGGGYFYGKGRPSDDPSENHQATSR